MQRLRFLLSESRWDHERVNARRVELPCADPATAPHAGGALVVDDTGDRKDGTATAHTAHQYPDSVGKIENGIVAVTTRWADERVYCLLRTIAASWRAVDLPEGTAAVPCRPVKPWRAAGAGAPAPGSQDG
ncbi:hypothetical protein GCM10010517_34270 [Streptosporangium fragile]|uniref:Transposase IS701-like DDE domain-containing protein n=1 Tax=Streptosporangium fragile TaxID=46186 RepID=A0ABN3VYI2_9ACTN